MSDWVGFWEDNRAMRYSELYSGEILFYFISLVTTMIPHGAVMNTGGYEHKRYSTSRSMSLILGRHLFSTVYCDSALDLQEP